MTIDCRTISRWYPDADLRRKLSYTFAHRHLPTAVHHHDIGVLFDRVGQFPGAGSVLMAGLWKTMTLDYGLETVVGIIRVGRLDTDEGLAHTIEGMNIAPCGVGSLPGLLIRFPEPADIPHAKLALIVRSPANPGSTSNSLYYTPPSKNSQRYFTLELTEPEANSGHPVSARRGVLCEWTADASHRNFGLGFNLDDPGLEASFVSACANLALNPDATPRISSRADADNPRARHYTFEGQSDDEPPDQRVLE